MFVHRGHTSKGVIITGKVSALYAGDCRFKSLPGMFFCFFSVLFDNALMMMNPLFGFPHLGCQGFLKNNSQPLNILY